MKLLKKEIEVCHHQFYLLLYRKLNNNIIFIANQYYNCTVIFAYNNICLNLRKGPYGGKNEINNDNDNDDEKYNYLQIQFGSVKHCITWDVSLPLPLIFYM